MHAAKSRGGADVCMTLRILNLGTNGGEWSTSRFCRFTAPTTHLVHTGWARRVGSDSGLRPLEKKNVLPFPAHEPARNLVGIPTDLTQLARNDDQNFNKLNVFFYETENLHPGGIFLSFFPFFRTYCQIYLQL